MNSGCLERCRWPAVSGARALEQAAIEMILASAALVIQECGQFRMVLAGGDTQREIYRGLRTARTDWPAWHIYFGDLRCLPRDESARNSRMAAELCLDCVPIPSFQLYPIPAELDERKAAQLSAETLQPIFESR